MIKKRLPFILFSLALLSGGIMKGAESSIGFLMTCLGIIGLILCIVSFFGRKGCEGEWWAGV